MEFWILLLADLTKQSLGRELVMQQDLAAVFQYSGLGLHSDNQLDV